MPFVVVVGVCCGDGAGTDASSQAWCVEMSCQVVTGECRSGSTSSVAECDVYGGWAVPLHDGWLGADGAPGGRQA